MVLGVKTGEGAPGAHPLGPKTSPQPGFIAPGDNVVSRMSGRTWDRTPAHTSPASHPQLVQLRPPQARLGLRGQPSPSESARGWTTAPSWPLGWTFSCLRIRTMVSDAPQPRPPPEMQLKQETQTQLPETLAGPHMAAPTQLFFK